MLIDIRHEASHNELPALPLLRTAASQALAWLQATYWKLQSEHLVACRERTHDLLEVGHLYSSHSHRPLQTSSHLIKDLPCETGFLAMIQPSNLCTNLQELFSSRLLAAERQVCPEAHLEAIRPEPTSDDEIEFNARQKRKRQRHPTGRCLRGVLIVVPEATCQGHPRFIRLPVTSVLNVARH